MTRSGLNVLGGELIPCSYDPLTGYFRDGCCNTSDEDAGTHVICAKVTQAFLDFSLSRGNDLVTPRPEHRFAGLKAGDQLVVEGGQKVRAGAAVQVQDANAQAATPSTPVKEG